MMINNDITLKDAIEAAALLEKVMACLAEAERLAEKAEHLSGVDCDLMHVEDAQAAIVMASEKVEEAIGEYTSEPVHTEGLEVAGRV